MKKNILIWILCFSAVFLIYLSLYSLFYIIFTLIFSNNFKIFNLCWLILMFIIFIGFNIYNNKINKKIKNFYKTFFIDIENIKENNIFLDKIDYPNIKPNEFKEIQRFFVKEINNYFKKNNKNYKAKIYKNGYVKIIKDKKTIDNEIVLANSQQVENFLSAIEKSKNQTNKQIKVNCQEIPKDKIKEFFENTKKQN